MKRNWLYVIAIIAVTLSVWSGLPARNVNAADSDIVISEVVFDATCQGATDTVCNAAGGENHFEWVEIYNKGAAVSLNGWSICDLGGTPACDALPNQTIQSGEYWIIAYNTTALQTEFDQYTPGYTVNPARTISLGSAIGGGLRNTPEEGIYLVNNLAQDVTCVSWGDTNTLCSARTTLGSKTDTAFQTANGQSIANIGGTWYLHGPTDGPQQASPYQSNTSTTGPSAVTLNNLTAASTTSSPVPIALGVLCLTATALLLRRRITRAATH